MAQKFLSIKNFEKYQRYKDRLPPWIKLHYALLEDPDWMMLDEVQQCRYMKLLLIASRCDNRIADDQFYLQNMLRVRGNVDLTPLIHAGFLVTFGAKKRRLHVQVPSLSVHRETETETETDIPAAVETTPRALREVSKPKSSESWESYRDAYRLRYGADPIRNASVNGMLSRLVDRVGSEAAPQVAAFYVQHNNPFYVGKRHPVSLLLADCEGLHTQWVTGVKATTGEAKNAERRDDAQAQIARVKAMMGEA